MHGRRLEEFLEALRAFCVTSDTPEQAHNDQVKHDPGGNQQCDGFNEQKVFVYCDR